MSTDLYKQAVLEAKKLREIAEQDAKNAIIEELTPFIRKTISEHISGVPTQFFVEQEEDEEEQTPEPVAGADASVAPTTTDVTNSDDLAPELGDQSVEPPIEANGEDIIDASLPDEEGKITVDFEDLFVGGDESDEDVPPVPVEGGEEMEAPEVPIGGTGEPVPTESEGREEELPLAGESVDYENFRQTFLETVEKIDRVYFSESVSDISQEYLREKLLNLLEINDKLVEEEKISPKQAKINENKLEFLFLKLKEAGQPNSYIKKDKNKMASLKEYAAKLFKEESTMAEEAEDVNQPTTASGKHAAEVSGVSDEIGGPDDLKAESEESSLNEEMEPGTAGSVDADPLPGTDPEPKAEEQWADGEPALKEEDQDKVIEEALESVKEEIEAEGSAGFGDTDEEPPVEFEIDEAELTEALNALKEASDGSDNVESWEDGEPEKEDPSHDNLKEGKNLQEQEDIEDILPPEEPVVDVEEGEEEMDMDMDDVEGDLVLSIDLPDEIEDALADVDVSAMDDVEVELTDINLGDEVEAGEAEAEEEAPLADAGEIEVDDIIAEPESEEEGEEEEAMPEMEEQLNHMKEAYNKLRKEKAAFEKKTKHVLESYRKELKKTKGALKEAHLFVAKNVYFTKCMRRKGISESNLQKIAGYLDGAKTVTEAKKIYGIIKVKLNEAKVSKKLAGSSSQVTKPGSANTLKESVQHDPKDPIVNTVSRWQYLAGIKTNKE